MSQRREHRRNSQVINDNLRLKLSELESGTQRLRSEHICASAWRKMRQRACTLDDSSAKQLLRRVVDLILIQSRKNSTLLHRQASSIQNEVGAVSKQADTMFTHERAKIEAEHHGKRALLVQDQER